MEFSSSTPLNESKTNETFRLICRDADAMIIEVQTNNEWKSDEANSIRELFVVKTQENGNQPTPIMNYLVSEKREKVKQSVCALIRYCFCRQSDSAHIKMENLAVNTSYNVTVSIVNAKREYRHLAETMVVHTLSSKSHRPKTILNESIVLSDFSIGEDPHSLSAFVLWKPADGMCFVTFSTNKII